MNRLVLVCLSSFLLPPAFAQETYKCKTPGGMVYQDRPCAGVRYAAEPQVATSAARPTTAEPITPAAVASPAAPTAAPVQTDMERSKAYLASRAKERRVNDLKEQITHTENSIVASQQLRDAELANLHAQKALATNNLAGATWEQSLALESQAITSRYTADIDLKREQLRRLRDELAQVK